MEQDTEEVQVIRISQSISRIAAHTREDDGWVHDEGAGRTFWGSEGSGILFVRHHPVHGVQILVTLRVNVDESGTWGTLGGAVPRGQDSFMSALQEAEEEVGSLPPFRRVTEQVYESGGSFRYTNYVLECLDLHWLPTGFMEQGELDREVGAAEWVTLEEAFTLPLHFGLEALLGAVGDEISGIGVQKSENIEKTELQKNDPSKNDEWTHYEDESKPVLVRDDNRVGLIQ